MTFYKYNTYGWYIGASDSYVPYSTNIPLPKQEPEMDGYQFNWHDTYWAYVPYVEPPEPPEPAPIPVPDIPVDTILTPMSFVRRFTLEEELKLRQEAKTDIVINALLNNLLIVKYVDLADERVIGGIRYLVEKAFISQERADEILTAPVQPFEK